MAAVSQGIVLKKRYGQHFLRDQAVVDHMLEAVALTPTTSVFEIGCGDGFLTKSILQTSIARLWVFEIDPEWATYVKNHFPDKRMTMFEENILDADMSRLEPHKPWTLLSNLPYQVTFPILYLLQKNKALLKEGVIMVQEEVAQKLLKTQGRDYGFSSLFFQHHFEWKMLDKVPPGAFLPPPKVYSRLLYFKPRAMLDTIPQEEDFWKFVKIAFRQPRRTLRNNLVQSDVDVAKIPDATLALRAQQMSKEDILNVWKLINAGT
jgi:16S rRNA (adenine1518-N6/adenine1519-N6)-dimethyltransferase